MTTTPDRCPRGDRTSGDDGVSAEPIRLLVADDEQPALSALRELFGGDGYELYVAATQERAVAILAEQPIDVVITDLHLPKAGQGRLVDEAQRDPSAPMWILLSRNAEREELIEQLNAGLVFAYLSKPWEAAELCRKVQAAALRRREALQERERQQTLERTNESLAARVSEYDRALSETRARLREATLDIQDSYQAVVKMLAHMADLRMPETEGHGQRVALIARRMAQALKLPKDQVRDIETAALLHDIGLVVIPDQVRGLSDDSMSPDQLELFRRHSELGEVTLVGIPAMRDVAAMVRSHHERFDGRGFPDGLVGEEIPLGARIISVANDYQDYVDGEITGTVMSGDDAFGKLRQAIGSRYDAALVDLLGQLRQSAQGIELASPDAIRTLRSSDLEPGMVLSEKLLSREGVLLLTAGQRLSPQAIEAIRRLEAKDGARYLINVYDRGEDAPTPAVAAPATASQTPAITH